MLEAIRGYDPSYSWRSMWGAKSFLLDGLLWRVGDGHNIEVWKDLWLPGCNVALLPRHGVSIDPGIRVSALIDPACGEWKSQMVRHLFTDEVSTKILQLPHSSTQAHDCQYWWPSKYGEYSVKPGYWLGRMGRLRVELDGMDEENKETWRTAWRIGGPPKLSHFLWQACRGSMAVKEVLFRRHIASDDLCGCCGLESESIIHVLFECTEAKSTWVSSTFYSIINEAHISSFAARLIWLASKVSNSELRSIMAITWAIWFCRNKRVHEQEHLNGTMITSGFVRIIEEHGTYVKKVHSAHCSVQPLLATTWNCPPTGMIKLNVDAHVTGLYAGLGVVVRDELGNLLLTATKRVDVGLEVEVAETMAARYGAQVARKFGFDSVWIENDVINVSRAVDTKMKGLSPLFLIYDNICELSKLFHVFVISRVKNAR